MLSKNHFYSYSPVTPFCIDDPDADPVPFGGADNGNTDDDPLFAGVPVAYWKMDDDAANPWVAGLNGVPTELVTNNTFDDGSDWTEGTNWAIGGGSALCTGQSGYLVDNNASVEIGKYYLAVFEVKNYVTGGVYIEVGDTACPSKAGNGVYIERLYATGPNTQIRFHSTFGPQNFRVDNVYVICLDDFPNTGIFTDATGNPNTDAHHATGLIGGALSFGGDDYVDVRYPADGSLDFGDNTDFTISAWFKTTSANKQMIVNKRSIEATSPGYETYMDGGKIYAAIADGSSIVSINTTDTFDNNSWHHVVVVYDREDDVMTMYVDGDFKTSANISTIENTNTSQTFAIGACDETAYFNGTIDEVMIFDWVLSPDLAAGPDGIFGTLDDGLRLMADSPCIDAADGDAAPSTDILARPRFDTKYVDNDGRGSPNYAEIGAYEFPPHVVVMCWIDEAGSPPPGYHPDGYTLYNTHINKYRNLIELNKLVVKSGCLVPSDPNPEDPDYHTIEDVLPDGCSPPSFISIEDCNRKPNANNMNEFIEDFDRIRNGAVPDYLLLSVDSSGSLGSGEIDPAYSDFKSWVNEPENYPDTVIKARDQAGQFDDEMWVDEMRITLQDNVVFEQ